MSQFELATVGAVDDRPYSWESHSFTSSIQTETLAVCRLRPARYAQNCHLVASRIETAF